jgi:hypothetical protein
MPLSRPDLIQQLKKLMEDELMTVRTYNATVKHVPITSIDPEIDEYMKVSHKSAQDCLNLLNTLDESSSEEYAQTVINNCNAIALEMVKKRKDL